MRATLFRAALAAVLAGAALAASAQARYRVTGVAGADFLRIGNGGTAVSGQPSVAWDPVHGRTEIPGLDYPGGARPRDVNVHGDVVGLSEILAGSFRPFLWDRAGGTRAFAQFSTYSEAHGINDSGEIVGWFADATGRVSEGFRWTAVAGLTVLPRPSSTAGASALDVNNTGQVLGYIGRGNVPRDAVVWQADDAITYLGLMGNQTQTDPAEITDDGWVCGSTFGPRGNVGFVWRPDGTFVEIPNSAQPGRATFGIGINASHAVAGWMTVTSQTTGGFIWTPEGGTQVLNDLLAPGYEGWDVQYAHDVNDHGQVVGYGKAPNGQMMGVVLDPVPEPSLLLAVPAALVAFRRRRRPSKLVRSRDRASN